MDIIAHGVYNIALQKTISKDKKDPKDILTAFGWGIVPDLLAFGIPFSLAIFSGSLDHHAKLGGFDIAGIVYPYTHSLIIFGAIFFVVYAVRRKWYLSMLGWGFHILLDIPFHTADFFPTPFLFPISNYALPFGIYWGAPLIWISIWVVGLSWLWAVFYRKQKGHLE